MQHHTSLMMKLTNMWKNFQDKSYRDAYVSADISDTITAQVIALRKKLGLSQKQLAEKAGMKQSRISDLENLDDDNVSIDTLKRLASAFDVALTVRFIPFSELVHWVQNLSPEKIAVKCFNEDSIATQSAAPEFKVSLTMDQQEVPPPARDTSLSYYYHMKVTQHAQARAS